VDPELPERNDPYILGSPETRELMKDPQVFIGNNSKDPQKNNYGSKNYRGYNKIYPEKQGYCR
jgi:hypothetical protein